MSAPGGFPYWTLLAGLAGAAVLALVRPRTERAKATVRPRWQPLDAALLLLLVGLALTLRLLFLDGRVVDNDEPVSLGLTSLDAWARETDARLHPPLPALLMALASRGVMDLDAARGVSVLAGVGTVALAFGVARRQGRLTGVFAGALLAVMPAALHTSQLARGYALAALFVLAFHAALSRALDSGAERWWLATTACAAAAAWSEYIAVLPIALDALVALWFVRRDPRRSAGVLTSLLGAAALCSPLLPFVSRFRGVGGGDHPASGALLALGDALALLSGAAPRVLGALALLVAIGWARDRDSTRRAAAILGVLALATLGATFTAVRARYVLDMVPLFAVTLATSLAAMTALPRVLMGAAVAVAHAGLVPAYYAGAPGETEISTGLPAPAIVAALAKEPTLPIAVVPYYAVAEPSWRLGHAFPGRDAKLTCPGTLCARGNGRLFIGAMDPGQVARRVAPLFVWQRGVRAPLPPSCRLVVEEASSSLWQCTP